MNYVVSLLVFAGHDKCDVSDTVKTSDNDEMPGILFEIEDSEMSDTDEISSFFDNANYEVFETGNLW